MIEESRPILAPETRSTALPPAPPSGGRARAVRAALKTVVPRLREALRVVLPDGEVVESRAAGPGAPTMTIHSDAFFARSAESGKIGFGESYMAGEWSADDLVAVLSAWAVNVDRLPAALQRAAHLSALGRRREEFANTLGGARRNIQHHYDLSNELFELFLDRSMTYSSAIFSPGDTLERAQERKRDLLLDDLELDSGHHLLEIGTGWGALALHAARRFGCRVTSVTLSVQQHDHATELVHREGLQDLVDIRLCDYRNVEGRFDRVVSVEMIEAVGERFWPTFFHRLRALVPDDGRISLQTITTPHRRWKVGRNGYGWIHKYVFPGGEIPSLRALNRSVEQGGLSIVSDREIGRDYVLTLRSWRERFLDRIDDVYGLGFDDVFVRLWDFYLAYSEAGFATGLLGNSQLVMTPKHR